MNTYEELVFLQDEVRDGFYIPTAVKQAWIEELYILKEIDAVCKKHRITYFADWGTQLALVRHGGFIPWDDDLDICMKREDYENFRAHQDELPEGFFVQDYSNTDDHWFYIAKVVSQNHISFDEEFLKEHHNFPYMVNVDIFILDYVYADREKEKQRDSDILTILALADGIRERTMSDESAADILKKLNDSFGTSYAFDGTDGSRHDLSVALYSLSERLMQTASESESDCATNIFPWGLKQMFYREKSIYAETVSLPYENTSIPTSTEYNRLTGELYHNYMEVHKNWDGHTYPFFESQKKELEELNGGRLPFEFSFDASMLRKSYPSEMREPNEKRQVVFLVTGRRRWKAFSGFLRDEEKEGSEITVTYLPFFFKEPDGTIIYDEKLLEKQLSFAKSEMPAEFREHYRDYRDCELGTPDAVYICDPYDDRNPCFSIPPEFYTARLQEVTDVIAYVAPYEVGDFSDEPSPDMTVLRYYVDEPAVIRADWVFVPMECMKSHYIDELSRFAGEQTCEYWQNIVTTYEPEREEISKSLLFCVGLSRFTERDENFEKTLAELDLDIHERECDVTFFPDERDEWVKILGESQVSSIEKVTADKRKVDFSRDYQKRKSQLDRYAALRGDPSPLTLHFR